MTVFLKPKDQKPRPKKRRTRKKLVAVKVMRDGREICNRKTLAGRREYMKRTFEMCERQGWVCGCCTRPLSARYRDNGTCKATNATFDHENLRGGGKQDDRIEVDGVWQNAAMDFMCNLKKGSRRIPYLKHAVNKSAVRR